ncbi:MAG: PD-(D/E)XK nuclease family protein [Phycisphaerae bacterium]|nr:PD-(D/E)XK nuclease family protein [Phycisphaerae bacterium]
MEPTGRQDELIEQLLEQLLAPDARAVLLYGPAGCGKTTAALEVYRRFAPEGEVPTARLLAPNDAAARDLTRRLLATTDRGVLLHPRAMTFADLAGRVLSAAGRPMRRIGGPRRRLLLRRIVRDLHTAGALRHLGSVVDTPGLITALQRNLSELKRATADPEELARRVGSSSGPAGDVLRVYQAYQQALNAANACDADGQLWLARDALRDWPEEGLNALGFPNLRVLIVDGFTDFTPTQLEILALLRPGLERLIVTLPLGGEGDGRDRLWLWTRRTQDRLREALGDDPREIFLAGHSRENAFTELTGNVFRYDVIFPRPDGLEIIAAPGMEAEVREVARRVKRRLLSGRAPRVAVLARDIEPYRPVIERVFRRMHIPVRPAGQPLCDAPAVKFCFAVADLAQPGRDGLRQPFAFRQILRVLRNSYFRPEAFGAFDATTVAVAEMIIRRGNVLAGRDACARAVERLAHRAIADEDGEPLDLGPLCADESALRSAGDLLSALFDLAEAARTPSGFLTMLEKLDLPAAIRRRDDPAGVARDLAALDALRQNMVSLADEFSTDSPADLEALRDALGEISLPAPRGESLVDVLDVLDARAPRWDHVFLLGCDEGQFPRRFSENSLLGEADRRAWRDAGVRLDLRGDLTAREMLLFYLAVSRAEKTLTISYRKSDAMGRPGAPGGFLQALVDGLGGFDALHADGALTSPPVGQFIPPAEQIAAESEALAAAVMGQFQREGQSSPAVLRWAEQNAAARLRRAVIGANVLRRRWAPGACGPFDGRLNDPVLLEELRRTVPAQTIFSAAQLSTYNQCPWRYFARYILNAAPLESPDRQLQAVDLGLFCHNVLCATLSGLAASRGRPLAITRIDADTLLDALDQAFQAEARQIEARRPVYPALWDIQRRQMRKQLREYLLAQQTDEVFQPECLRFELSFGRQKDPAEWMDPASRPEPVEVETPVGTIRLRGRIDRVDRVKTAAGEGLLVVDYKTGRLPGPKESLEGRNTQMPLYTAAAESLLGAPALGGAFHGLKENRKSFFSSVKVERGKLKEDKTYAENREQALAAVARAVEGIAAGQFDVSPAKDACRYCDYRRMCHFSPARDELRRVAAGGALR